ncbi:MAG: GIY-YIG nuclease family protein [archaeon]|nr:GIY-YIG nuclease family protein [archaeon]
MSVRKGTYALFIILERDETISIGARGPHLFRAGTYCYVGSAMAGLDQRLGRHLAREKKLKWHIDHLTTRCACSEAWESYPDFIPECDLAHAVESLGGEPEMDGFGCSDCTCRTHLFRVSEKVKEDVLARCVLERHF